MLVASDKVPNLTTALQGPPNCIEQQFFDHQTSIESWFRKQWLATPPPFYGSVDIRNAGFKLAPVDTNLFPAGFNNLNPDFFPLCVQAVQATIAELCPDAVRVLIISESHTRNPFYMENLAVLQNIISQAGFDTRIASLDPEMIDAKLYKLESGKELTVHPAVRESDRIGTVDFFPRFILLNNDLSSGIPDILQNVEQTVMPALQLGWQHRLKSEHFRFYHEVVEDFCQETGFDSWLLRPLFDQVKDVDFMERTGMERLMKKARSLLDEIAACYREYNIDRKPFLVVKADAGTYGMAVMMIKDPEELLELNRKQRTRMSSTKGGVTVSKVILQEGIYTFETFGPENAVAEPVVYMIGRHVVGGFYRVHKNRSFDENLNAPGMNFFPLAFDEACCSPGNIHAEKTDSLNRFYSYGVVSRLAFVAAARELAVFKGK